jgi:hypothetical protein
MADRAPTQTELDLKTIRDGCRLLGGEADVDAKLTAVAVQLGAKQQAADVAQARTDIVAAVARLETAAGNTDEAAELRQVVEGIARE